MMDIFSPHKTFLLWAKTKWLLCKGGLFWKLEQGHEILRPKKAELQSPKLSLLYFLHREDVKRLLAAYTKDFGPSGLDVAFAEYSSTWGSSPSQDTIKKTAVELGTDYIFTVPSQIATYLHADNSR